MLVPKIAPAARIIICGVAAIFTWTAASYWDQDRSFQTIETAAGTRSLDQMLRAYHSSTELWFPASRDDLWCSRQFAQAALGASGESAAKAWAAAATASARAESTTDNPADAFYQSAMLAFGRNDAVLGERKLRQAIRFAPNWYRPHLVLAQLLRVTGRISESQSEANRSIYLSGALQSEVQTALSPAVSRSN